MRSSSPDPQRHLERCAEGRGENRNDADQDSGVTAPERLCVVIGPELPGDTDTRDLASAPPAMMEVFSASLRTLRSTPRQGSCSLKPRTELGTKGIALSRRPSAHELLPRQREEAIDAEGAECPERRGDFRSCSGAPASCRRSQNFPKNQEKRPRADAAAGFGHCCDASASADSPYEEDCTSIQPQDDTTSSYTGCRTAFRTSPRDW